MSDTEESFVELQTILEEYCGCGSIQPGGKTSNCDIEKTPTWLLGFMVSILRQWYGSTTRITSSKSNFVWNRDPEKSGIYINDEFNWDYNQIQSRPAIIVELSDISLIENFSQVGKNGIVAISKDNGAMRYASIDEGYFLVRCIGKQKLEAWDLAWNTKNFLRRYMDPIKSFYRFRSFEPIKIEKPLQMEMGEKYMVSSIHIRFNIVDSWVIQRDSLKVQTITTNITLM